jgi:diadenosine tetraphosphate (Ap4A) HIT family hydrolase
VLNADKKETPCALCEFTGGELVWKSALYRVILADEPDYPGFCRVIWHEHIAEMTDLPPLERQILMAVVWAVEETIRATLSPDKVNVASLGNVVPHLHWHVIPRWRDDRHFPAPVWAAPAREAKPRTIDLAQLKAALASKLLMLESLAKD